MLFIVGRIVLGNELTCISELPVPVYPPLARMAGVDGKIDLTFQLERDGTVTNVSIVNSPRLFAGSANLLAKTVKFTSNCSARQIHITVLFQVDRTAERDQSSAHTVKFIAPGTFVVKAPLATVNVANVDLLRKDR